MNLEASINHKTCAVYLNSREFYKAIQNRVELFTEPEKKVIAKVENVATSKNLTDQERASYMHDHFAKAALYNTFEEAYDALMSKYYAYYTSSMLRTVGKYLISYDKSTKKWGSGVTHTVFNRLVYKTVDEIFNKVHGGDRSS